jgi:hypothetical protein
MHITLTVITARIVGYSSSICIASRGWETLEAWPLYYIILYKILMRGKQMGFERLFFRQVVIIIDLHIHHHDKWRMLYIPSLWFNIYCLGANMLVHNTSPSLLTLVLVPMNYRGLCKYVFFYWLFLLLCLFDGFYMIIMTINILFIFQ